MRTWIRILAKVFAGYIAASVLLILPALNILAPRVVHDSLGRELHSEIILFNPFTLAIEIRNAAILDPDAETFLSVDRAQVNLSLESVWHTGLVFDAVVVESLYVHVKRHADSSFNFSDMLGEPSVEDNPSGGELPGLTIHHLALHSRQIRFTDEARETAFSTHWDGLSVSVHELSTIHEEGRPYSFDAMAESGGKLHWEGVVSVPGAYSEGTLALENLSLHPMWRFAQDWVAFELEDGQLSFAGDYRLDWNNELVYRISNGSISVANIDVQPQDREALPETAVQLASLELTGIAVDGPAQSVELAAVAINGVNVQGFSEGSEHSLQTLFEMHLPGESAGPGTDAANDSEAGSNWTLYVPDIHLDGSQLRWRSQYTSPALLEVSPIDIQLTELRWPPENDSSLSLALTINGITNVAVNGDVSLADGNGMLNYQLDKIQLTMLNPNLPKALKAEITAGDISAEGKLTLAAFSPARVTMNGRSIGFAGTMEDADDAILGWDAIRWQELDLNLAQHSVELKTLSLQGYSGRLHIYEDGTINAQSVLSKEVEEAVEKGAIEEESLQQWTFDIPSISIADSQLYFKDDSLPLEFGTVIGELNGDILGLGSNPEGETTINLKGSVDAYAPVLLTGTLSPFADTSTVDIALRFDGVDLVRLTPYSGTYAGYAIDRGILNLDLHYSLEGSRLRGNNSVVIEQLKLGEEIDSDKAVDLPLELALALLTDMNGVIDMNIPVSGETDDPEFGLGSVIFSALVNIVSKAITAPFALLANLVGSEEDMQRITFASGSSNLDEAAAKKLTELSSALLQRPGLNLVLLGRLHPSADRERLQKEMLGQQLQSAGLSAEDLASKGEQWAQAIQQRYNLHHGGDGKKTDAPDVSTHEQYQQLVANVVISEAQLRKLAEERAVSVKRFLVNELQLPAGRSAIELVDVEDEGNSFSGVELAVGT